MQEHGAEAHGGAVHEDELARHGDAAVLLQRLVDLESLLAAVLAGLDAVGHRADAVVEDRPVDEAGPDVQRVDQRLAEVLEAPGLVGVDDARLIVRAQALVEVDHARHELRREDADAAVVEQVDPRHLVVALAPHRVVAEVGVAVDHAVMAEGHPPGLEHRDGDAVTHLQRLVLEGEELAAVEPFHGEQAVGRQLRIDLRHPHLIDVVEHQPVEGGVLGFAPVVQLLAQAGADLLDGLARVDGRAHAPLDGEQHLELAEVRLDRRGHVGILQLAGQRRAGEGGRAVHLAERGRGGGLEVEGAEAVLPVEAELGRHAAAHEGGPHGRGLVLQLGELLGIFGRDRVRDGGQELRHLHQRALEAAERLRERRRVGGVAVAAEEPRPRHPGRDAADVGADAGVAGRAGGESVLFVIGHRGRLPEGTLTSDLLRRTPKVEVRRHAICRGTAQPFAPCFTGRPASLRWVASSPDWNISRTMSQPPTNSPLT